MSRLRGPYRTVNIGVNGPVYRVIRLLGGGNYEEVDNGRVYLSRGAAASSAYRLNRQWEEEQILDEMAEERKEQEKDV